ncbi:MAG: DUF3667 domain-containing protein [bacterium]
MTDVDGRVLRTLRALFTPGLLTTEYLRGRRAPYFGPLKLFLATGSVLTTTWVRTRSADAAFYGLRLDPSAATYIASVVRGLIVGGMSIAITSWALAGGRRRLLDEIAFALHVVSAAALQISVVVWVGAALKLGWGSSKTAPSLLYLLFLPAMILGELYFIVTLRRVYGGAWWAAVLRAIIVTGVGLATLWGVIMYGSRILLM